MTWEHLERGSSPVDWCEGNYQISPNIAEFVNTFSNFIFILFPPILIHLFKDYGYFINQGIHIIWVLLIIVGLSSAYFHATLSLIGQLLDEVAILWVCSAAFSMFSPKAFFPKFLKGDRNKFSAGIAIITAICTVLSVWQPAVNAFALMFLVIPASIMLYNELKVQKCERVVRLGIRCCLVLGVALICWLTDRFCCDTWFGEHFPYLHGFWHIFIFIASYTATVLFAYFAVQHDHLDRIAELKYWPVNEFEFGIPMNSGEKCWYFEQFQNLQSFFDLCTVNAVGVFSPALIICNAGEQLPFLQCNFVSQIFSYQKNDTDFVQPTDQALKY